MWVALQHQVSFPCHGVCRDIAEVSAVAFYRYGSSLVTGHANGVVVTRDICQNIEVRQLVTTCQFLMMIHIPTELRFCRQPPDDILKL